MYKCINGKTNDTGKLYIFDGIKDCTVNNHWWETPVNIHIWVKKMLPVYVCINGKVYHAGKSYTVYPKKYAHGFVVLCFVVVMQ